MTKISGACDKRLVNQIHIILTLLHANKIYDIVYLDLFSLTFYFALKHYMYIHPLAKLTS